MSEPTIFVKHPYYCSDGCYYSNNCETSWSSFAAYLAEMGEADVDMNFVWRWDVKGIDPEDNPGWTVASLHLYMMHQRKAKPHTHIIQITREDEAAILAYLGKHWQTMQAIWAPFAADSSALADEAAKAYRAKRIATLRAELAILEGE